MNTNTVTTLPAADYDTATMHLSSAMGTLRLALDEIAGDNSDARHAVAGVHALLDIVRNALTKSAVLAPALSADAETH